MKPVLEEISFGVRHWGQSVVVFVLLENCSCHVHTTIVSILHRDKNFHLWIQAVVETSRGTRNQSKILTSSRVSVHQYSCSLTSPSILINVFIYLPLKYVMAFMVYQLHVLPFVYFNLFSTSLKEIPAFHVHLLFLLLLI